MQTARNSRNQSARTGSSGRDGSPQGSSQPNRSSRPSRPTHPTIPGGRRQSSDSSEDRVAEIRAQINALSGGILDRPTRSPSHSPSRSPRPEQGERTAYQDRIAENRARAERITLPSDGRKDKSPARTPRSADSRGRGSRTGRGESESARDAAREARGAAKAARQKQYIDPKLFVQDAKFIEKADYVPEHAFTDFPLNPKILANVKAKGYERPSPIQDKTINLVLEGRDVVGIANTGTGKTAAFSLPMIHDLIHNMNHRALIMAPTRELAQQIQEEIISFSKGCNLRTALLIGGASMHLQIRDLRFNPRIVIGTPGRIKDHLQQKTLILSNITFAVLDEFDRMLDMGFINDIKSIFAHVPAQRQSLFFSATVDPKIEELIKKFSKNPVTISVKERATADSVKQDIVYFKSKEEKIDKLHDLLISKERGKTIIFDDTKRMVEKLGKELEIRGFKADRIHGNKSQAQRTRAITRLKSGEIDILVATDVAARGIDVSDITHVINFSQPNTYDDYVHRIGRTGRAGKTGLAFTFVQR